MTTLKKPIPLTDTQAIKAALEAANGKATAFTLTTADELLEVAERADELLADVLTKALRPGAEVVFQPAGPGKSYKHPATTTMVHLKLTARGWVLTRAYRSDTWPGACEYFDLQLTDKQHQIAAARVLAQFCDTYGSPRIRTEPVSAHRALEELGRMQAHVPGDGLRYLAAVDALYR